MKFSIVLWGLFLKMKLANRKNALFIKRLQSRTGSVLIRTSDFSAGRLYLFSRGRLFSRRVSEGEADVQLIWKNTELACQTMTSKDPLAMSEAIDSGNLKITGELMIAQWFNLLIKALKCAENQPTVTSSVKVAMIGLGKMGGGIATNIQNAGYDLVVYNRTSSKAKPFLDKGAVLATSPAEAAGLATVVLTSLMDDDSVRKLVTGKDGILKGLAKGGIHLCVTTISPELSKELNELHRKHGSYFVMSAVVGRPDAAKGGELLSLMAGNKLAVDQCRAIVSAYSAATIVIGNDPWMANYAKLSANYFAVSNMELMGQLYAMGDATGIGRAFYRQLFDSSYSNPILKFYANRIMYGEHDKEVGFELTGGLKDLKLMREASNNTSQSLAYAPIIIRKMEKALDQGKEHCDWSVFTEF